MKSPFFAEVCSLPHARGWKRHLEPRFRAWVRAVRGRGRARGRRVRIIPFLLRNYEHNIFTYVVTYIGKFSRTYKNCVADVMISKISNFPTKLRRKSSIADEIEKINQLLAQYDQNQVLGWDVELNSTLRAGAETERPLCYPGLAEGNIQAMSTNIQQSPKSTLLPRTQGEIADSLPIWGRQKIQMKGTSDELQVAHDGFRNRFHSTKHRKADEKLEKDRVFASSPAGTYRNAHDNGESKQSWVSERSPLETKVWQGNVYSRFGQDPHSSQLSRMHELAALHTQRRRNLQGEASARNKANSAFDICASMCSVEATVSGLLHEIAQVEERARVGAIGQNSSTKATNLPNHCLPSMHPADKRNAKVIPAHSAPASIGRCSIRSGPVLANKTPSEASGRDLASISSPVDLQPVRRALDRDCLAAASAESQPLAAYGGDDHHPAQSNGQSHRVQALTALFGEARVLPRTEEASLVRARGAGSSAESSDTASALPDPDAGSDGLLDSDEIAKVEARVGGGSGDGHRAAEVQSDQHIQPMPAPPPTAGAGGAGGKEAKSSTSGERRRMLRVSFSLSTRVASTSKRVARSGNAGARVAQMRGRSLGFAQATSWTAWLSKGGRMERDRSDRGCLATVACAVRRQLLGRPATEPA